MSPGLAPPYPWWRRGNLYFVNTSGSTPPVRQTAPARDSEHTPTPPLPPSPHPPSLPRPDHSEPSLAPLPPSELRPLIPPRAAAAPKRAARLAFFRADRSRALPASRLLATPSRHHPLAGATPLAMPSLSVHRPRSPPSRRPRWPPRLTQPAALPTRPVFLARKHLSAASAAASAPAAPHRPAARPPPRTPAPR